jgi:predicted AAA+ superfamily ATPase
MDRGLLKEVILEQNKHIENLDLGLTREDLGRIKRFRGLSHAVIISGIRRVGKSTLPSQIIHSFYREVGYYLNFEDERLINF